MCITSLTLSHRTHMHEFCLSFEEKTSAHGTGLQSCNYQCHVRMKHHHHHHRDDCKTEETEEWLNFSMISRRRKSQSKKKMTTTRKELVNVS